MAALDLSKLVKEKFWVASFLFAWAAALQMAATKMVFTHMMWAQRQDAFKDKFGEPDAPNKVTEHQQTAPSNSSPSGEQQEKVTADAEFR